MTIEELLDKWEQRPQLTKSNVGVAEFFFRTHYAQLQTSPEGYARAFDVLSKTIPWPRLQDYERTTMTEIIETTGLYATRAGKTLCKNKRSALAEWKISTRRAIAPLSNTDAMHNIMQSALTSALGAIQQLGVCRHAHPRLWLTYPEPAELVARMPTNESERLALMPWAPADALHVHKALVQVLCPHTYPLLDSLLTYDQWNSRRVLLSASMTLTSKKTSPTSFELPEEFEP